MSLFVAAATALSLVTLDGTARRADGAPEASALVCALPDPITEDLRAPTACERPDPSGAFRLQVPAGTYMVSATSPGTAGVIARKVEAGAPVELVLPPGGRTVSGRVLDTRGKPVPKAWVFALRKTGIDPDVFTVAADGKGRFALSLATDPFLLAATAGELDSEFALVAESGAPKVDLQFREVAKGPVPPEVTAWIRKKAIPLATVTAGSGFRDMEPLAGVVGDARVVALGEATHGTKEFFQLKHRMLEFLVRRMGFTTFAIEASLPDALAVDAYVVDGIGDPAQALSGLGFWTWNTEEVLALIRWMRQYNEDPGNARKLHFVGFDMQAAASTADRLARYLEKVAPGEDTSRLLAPLDPLTGWTGKGKPEPAEQAAVGAAIAAIDAYLREHEVAFRAASSPSAHALALQLVELLRQAQDVFWGSSFSARDRAMADNVLWWLQREPPGTRMVLWAHNGHVTFDDQVRAGEAMGLHLRRALGSEYLVFGFAFDRGAFQAVETGKSLHVMSVGAAKEQSLDAGLASAGTAFLALDLRRVPARGPVAEWFRLPRPARSVGAVFDPEHEDAYYVVQSAPRAYDALLFVGTTSSAVPVTPPRASGPRRALPETAANLDFEAEPLEGEPPGWFSPTKEGGYRVSVEDSAPAQGKRCARLDREGERRKSMPFGNLMQSVSAIPYRGKKVRFRASVRAEVSGTGNQAQLWLRVDREGQERGFFDNMGDRPIVESEWKPYEIVGEVADDAVSLNFGMILVGSGRAWIDEVSLEALETAP